MKITVISAEETWPVRHLAMWPDQPTDFVKLAKDPEGYHYGLFANSELVSVVSFFRIEDTLQFRKFATLPIEQGKGYGTHLLNFALDEQCTPDIRNVWCNARADKIDYYKRFGLNTTDKTFVKSGISYVIMEKNLSFNE
ncbi:MAG: GNAT family N-acetyltransferase [Cyclobacteriaceae bacterium]